MTLSRNPQHGRGGWYHEKAKGLCVIVDYRNETGKILFPWFKIEGKEQT